LLIPIFYLKEVEKQSALAGALGIYKPNSVIDSYLSCPNVAVRI